LRDDFSSALGWLGELGDKALRAELSEDDRSEAADDGFDGEIAVTVRGAILAAARDR
jgi:hypothetical protein